MTRLGIQLKQIIFIGTDFYACVVYVLEDQE